MRGAEVEELELRADVKDVEAHLLGPLQRPPQDPAGIALVGLATGNLDVAEHPADRVLVGAPGEDGERARVGHRDHVRLLDRVEPGDRGSVEAHAALEGVIEIVGVDREALQLTEDVGEPEPDEADAAIRDDAAHVLGGLGLDHAMVGHLSSSLVVWLPDSRGRPPYRPPRIVGVS